MAHELGDEHPDSKSFRQKVIETILDTAEENQIFDNNVENLRTILEKNLDLMNDIALGMLDELLDVLVFGDDDQDEVEELRSDDDGEDRFKGDETQELELEELGLMNPDDELLTVKVGQEVFWTLGKHKFTGVIEEVTDTQAAIRCIENNNRVYLDFKDFMITMDVDEQGNQIDIIPGSSVPEEYRAGVGEEICWFEGVHTREGVVTQIGEHRAQVKRHDTGLTTHIDHGKYWLNDDPPEESTVSTGSVLSRHDFAIGTRVNWYDSGKRIHGTVTKDLGSNQFEVDLDHGTARQAKSKWALNKTEWKDDPRNPKNGGSPPEDKTQGGTKQVQSTGSTYTQTPPPPVNPHLPLPSDKGDVVTRMVKPLILKP